MDVWHDQSLDADARATALLNEMTLEEVVGQLGSHWHRVEPDEPAHETSQQHDSAPMEGELGAQQMSWSSAIRDGLGHLTRTFGTAPLNVGQGRERLRSRQSEIMGASRFGIPALAHEECLTGFTALGATVYPAAIAWGATWRTELVREMAAAIGEDLHSVGIHQGLSPLLDVVRDYRWGRVEETCGEDPYLVGMLGTAYVQGLQSSGVHATLKHFVGYPASRAGRNHAPVSIGRRELEDVHLPPFEMAVREGGAASVMNSYCDIDGVPAAASHFLLTEVLRRRWCMEGPVVSDYWAIKFLTTMHRVAEDDATAAALAISAGMDVELPGTGAFASIPEAVDRGLLSKEQVLLAGHRVLRQKIELGLLDEDWHAAGGDAPDRDLDSQQNRDIARRMAEESIILLHNDGILPLLKKPRAVVIGPSWSDARSFLGCYSFPNHVLSRNGGTDTGLPIRMLGEALRDVLHSDSTFVAGTGFVDGSDDDIDEAVRAASDSEIAILTVGDIAGLFGIGTSGEGCDVTDLRLPGRQHELVEAVLETGTPTILVVITGRPYALGAYEGRCSAIVQAFMPGVEGADAITGVISGRVNPSGRLPIAVPRHHGGQPGTYLAPPLAWSTPGISNLDPRPLYAFGHGLSYTAFEHCDQRVSSSDIDVEGLVTYGVTIRNCGDREGSETVQLYLEDPWAEVVRPLKQLIGFAKVDLEPGAAARVSFEVHADRTSFTGSDMQRVVEPGEIFLSSGPSSEDRLPPLSVQITGARRVVQEGRVLITPVTVTSVE